MRIFAIPSLAVFFCCLILQPALGAIGAPKSVDRPAASRGQVVPADTIVTYGYDANGNRILESGFVPPPSTSTGTVIGTGVNFLGTGGADIFVRNPSGQVGVAETNSAGVTTSAVWLTNTNGSPAIVDNATTVIGTAQNFLGDGYPDIFLREASGQVGVVSQAPGGTLGVAVFLTNVGGSAAVVGSGTTVIGTGVNFFGDGNRELFLRLPTGQLLVVDETAAGVGVANLFLTNGDGSAATVGIGTTVIGTGVNFFGDGNRELFLRLPTGQLLVVDETAAGVGVANLFLTMGGNPFVVDQSSVITSTGTDPTSQQPRFVIRNSAGASQTYDVGPSGAATLQ